MRILITGGCGFVGANLVRHVLRHRPDDAITNLDALTYCGNRDSVAELEDDPRYTFVHGDVCDGPLVEKLVAAADAVIHLAAESHVDRSIADARPFIRSNVLGTQTVLDALRRVDPENRRRLVAVSTDEVYGALPLDRPDARFREDSPVAPRSPYAASKAAADMLVAAAAATHGIDACITRCSNNVGPYQHPDKVIPLFVTNLIDGLKIPLYGDGLHVREWIDVEDHCAGLLAVLERGAAGRVYNIGGGAEVSNLELSRRILALLGRGEDMIERVADRPGHDRRYALDAARIERELGFKPSRSAWPDSLQRAVRWYVENESWWRSVKEAG